MAPEQAWLSAFRVDRRTFSVGDTVLPTGAFSGALTPRGAQVESILEAARPDGKPRRSSVLYVFENIEAAKAFWCKMRHGKLYSVSLTLESLLHRADMTLTEELHASFATSGPRTALAKKYWRGDTSSSPVIEVLCDSATVTTVLSIDDQERYLEFKRRHTPWAL